MSTVSTCIAAHRGTDVVPKDDLDLVKEIGVDVGQHIDISARDITCSDEVFGIRGCLG